MEGNGTLSIQTTVRDLARPFAEVYEALDPKEHRKAMRSAMRRQGNRLKRQAAANLQASGIGQGTAQRLSKGIRLRVYPERYGAGFMLSVKPNRKKGYHRNRRGLEKPVLMWAEEGTGERRTKSRTRFFTRSRKGHSTGRMPRYGFMRRTEEQETHTVEQTLFGDFQDSLERAVRRKGLL